jgi:cell division protein FtsZ
VTAGVDLSIGEFEEVGSIVKEYASEDATVVVGTVIDPDMSSQLRVTVVATGLGRGAAAQRTRSEPARDSFIERSAMSARDASASREAAAARMADQAHGRLAKARGPLTQSDYSQLDKPTVVRQRAVGDGLPALQEAEEMLDIPAFLRRQAD